MMTLKKCISKKIFGEYKIFLFLVTFFFISNLSAQQVKWHYGQRGLKALTETTSRKADVSFCPPNIDFENGDFSNWQRDTGKVQDIGTTNLITVSPAITANANRFEVIPSTSTAVDKYGKFPVVCPNGSGHSIKLGNNLNGSQAERISYSFVVPSGLSEYSITYWYAVVFQNPGHQYYQQPRFQARVYIDGVASTCASFDYTATSGLPGFMITTEPTSSTDTTRVLYKEWSPVSINLAGNAGKTIKLEFTTVDCTEGGHFGYAYIDVNSCDQSDLYNDGSNFCDRGTSISASAPPGFQSYTWYYNTAAPGNLIGSGEHININPPPLNGSVLAVDIIPYLGFGCRDTIYTKVRISPMPKPSFTVDTNQLCIDGNKFNFLATSTIDSGTIVSNWNFGDNIKATGISQSHSYLQPKVYNVTLYATSNKGCTDSISKPVVVAPKPKMGYTVGTALHCLNGNSFPFTNTTTITTGTMSYNWSFDDSSPDETVQNPVHSYNAASTYTVKLKAVSDYGCKDSISKSVVVDANPTVSIVASTPATFCIYDSSKITSNVVAGSGSISNYIWFNNGLAMPGTTNTSITVNYVGSFYLTVANSQGCKASSDTIKTLVMPIPTGSITSQAAYTICNGDSVVLGASGGNSYQWSFNNAIIPGAVNATYAAMQEGIYTVRLQNVQNCFNMATGNVAMTVYKRPIVNFGFDKNCVGQPTQFYDSSIVAHSGTIKWYWDFGDNTNAVTQNPIHTFSAATYPVKLSVTPTYCPHFEEKVTKNVFMEVPNNKRYPTVNAVKNQPLQLIARTGKTYQWMPSFGLSNATLGKPIFNYTNEQEYRIRINTFAGCINTDTILVRIFNEKNIFVPKGFTPNKNGMNDELYPFLVGIKQLVYFKVFNRWGQLMYSTTTSDEKHGWNGKYNGIDQPSEAYTWIAEGIAYDGTKVKASGNTILLR